MCTLSGGRPRRSRRQRSISLIVRSRARSDGGRLSVHKHDHNGVGCYLRSSTTEGGGSCEQQQSRAHGGKTSSASMRQAGAACKEILLRLPLGLLLGTSGIGS